MRKHVYTSNYEAKKRSAIQRSLNTTRGQEKRATYAMMQQYILGVYIRKHTPTQQSQTKNILDAKHYHDHTHKTSTAIITSPSFPSPPPPGNQPAPPSHGQTRSTTKFHTSDTPDSPCHSRRDRGATTKTNRGPSSRELCTASNKTDFEKHCMLPGNKQPEKQSHRYRYVYTVGSDVYSR